MAVCKFHKIQREIADAEKSGYIGHERTRQFFEDMKATYGKSEENEIFSANPGTFFQNMTTEEPSICRDEG